MNYSGINFDPSPAEKEKAVSDIPADKTREDQTLFNLNIMDVSAEEGEFPAEILNTTNSLLAGKNLFQRLEKISEISQALANPTLFTAASATEAAAAVRNGRRRPSTGGGTCCGAS